MDKRVSQDDDQNAVETAVRGLRRMIFSGELAANQPLRQDELAELLGTSRHPVREALGRLSGEGLVTFRARRGYIVAALDPEEVNEIFEMRAVLEEHAGYLAALGRTAVDIANVSEILEQMRPLRRNTPREMETWSELNREFHARLFAASRRRHLCRIIGTLRDTVESYIRLTVANASLADAWRTHEEIFEAFRDGDALLLARLSRQHVRHSAESLLSRLRQATARDERSTMQSPRKPAGSARSKR
jgi:DNA-binding GntR family transcriptional regulator